MNIKSTAVFDFLLKNLSSLLRNLTYLSLLNSFLYLSRFSVSLKSVDDYFFRWFAYKSLFSRSSVLISFNMWSSNHFSMSSCFPCFSGSRFFRVKLFQGPGPGSGSRIQGPGPGSGVRFQGLGPGFRSSQKLYMCNETFRSSRSQMFFKIGVLVQFY